MSSVMLLLPAHPARPGRLRQAPGGGGLALSPNAGIVPISRPPPPASGPRPDHLPDAGDVVELRRALRGGDRAGPRGLGGRTVRRGPRLLRRPAGGAAAARRPPEATLTGRRGMHGSADLVGQPSDPGAGHVVPIW